MKSLLITNDFPPIVSGIGTVFYELWRCFPSARTLVLAPRVKGCKDFDKKHKLRIVRYRNLPISLPIFKICNWLLLLSYTFYLIWREKIGKVHCGQILSSGTIGLIFKYLFGRPYFLWTYGGETSPVYGNPQILRRFINLMIKKADKIVTISRFTTREFLNFGIQPGNIIQLLPGVNITIFYPTPKSQELVRAYSLQDKKVLLTISRLTERKGHDMVIKALPGILERVPNLRYLIVGKGPDEERLKKMVAAYKLESYVTFAGYISDDDLPRYYNLCDIYVMPNREVLTSTDSIEGFGISFIEASACGKPAIGGRSGGAEEAVLDGVTGFLVEPLNVDELVDKVWLLLKDEELAKRLGYQGRLRAEKSFCWQDRARKLRELL